MATYLFKDLITLVDEFDLSTKFNQAAMVLDAANLEATVFGNNTVIGKGGLLAVGLDYAGFFDADAVPADSVDKQFFDHNGLNRLVTVVPEGNTVDNETFSMEVMQTNYNHGASVGELLGFNFGAAGRSKPTLGTLKLPLTSRSASGASTKTQVGALAVTEQMVAYVHCTAFDGATLDIDVRSDADASAGGENVEGSFTQLTDIGSQRIVITGAVTNEYWDIDYTFSGTSFSIAVTIGIETIHLP